MYRAFGLLQSSSDFALDEAVSRLKGRFPGFTVDRAGNQITVSKDDWHIFLVENADPSVLAESAELAEKEAIRAEKQAKQAARAARKAEERASAA